MAVKILLWQFGTFLALFFECGSNTEFWHQYGVNLALTNDFIVDGTVENLAFSSVKELATRTRIGGIGGE